MSSSAIAAIIIALIVVALCTAVLCIQSKVRGESPRLTALAQLNQSYQNLVAMPLQPINYSYTLKSKAQFDRFNPEAALISSVMLNSEMFEAQVQRYRQCCGALAGYGSQVERIVPTAYTNALLVREEARQFKKKRLKPQTAYIRATVTWGYTSPKGRNSYRSQAVYTDDSLARVVDKASQQSGKKAVYEAHRTQERAAMTPALRYDVLRRDGFKCVKCGATAEMGAVLHVDHIIPVSKGGMTEMSNLQTLCQDCNLGKGNRYAE